MRKLIWLGTLIVMTFAFIMPVAANNDVAAKPQGSKGKVVIANRGSGSISVIDATTNELIGTFGLPADGNSPEPMYVTYSKRGDHVFVGDRANDYVVVFDADDFSVVATIPAGDGVFHMWSDPHDRQLWVNNDIDKTATVIDPVSLNVIATVPMPADLVADGYKPHDVVLEPRGRFAYVTMIGGAGSNDYVVQFDTDNFSEVNRAPVGKDAHVSLTQSNKYLYVPAQNSNMVTVLNRYTMEPVTDITVPGAHGAGMAPNGKVFYTTNISGGGTDGLFAIGTKSNTILGTADTPYSTPHNIVVTKNKTLFLTHSEPTLDKVTIYDVSTSSPVPMYIGEVTVGLNPFGLAYVPGN
ncbi:MAG: beta-propeller fold lactonase family protein [Anaerolineae bacterium]|nr:beta-propeller fold lactonase family protein [Anaerolineae bacterium]